MFIILQKEAIAVAHCKSGSGLIKINGCPIELVQPETLRIKTFEPILLLGRQRFENVDIRIRVKGGGQTAQIYGMLIYECLCGFVYVGYTPLFLYMLFCFMNWSGETLMWGFTHFLIV